MDERRKVNGQAYEDALALTEALIASGALTTGSDVITVFNVVYGGLSETLGDREPRRE